MSRVYLPRSEHVFHVDRKSKLDAGENVTQQEHTYRYTGNCSNHVVQCMLVCLRYSRPWDISFVDEIENLGLDFGR